MKKLLALLIMGVLIAPAFAQNGSISGFVWDANTSLPIVGVDILAIGPDSGFAYTDSIGAYQVTGLYPGSYTVIAHASGYESGINQGIIVYAGQNTPDVNFWLVPSGVPEYGSISGFVNDTSTGMPIPGAHVIAQGPGWGDDYTDSVGAYQITDLEQGWYVVEASAPGYEPVAQGNVQVYAGQNTPNVNFWLYSSGGSDTGISGLVTNAQNNNPIFGALVIAANLSGSGQDNTNYYGEYFIQNLSPDFYLVTASAIGFEPAVYPDSVEVIDGQITIDIDFALVPLDTTQLGGISGYITDAEYGYPIPFAQVYASGPNGQGQTCSDSIGVYLIYDLSEGNYEVRAAAWGYYPATYPESVLVNAGQITSDIDFALTPSDTGGVAGFVVDGETGLTIPNAQITATGPSGTIQVESNEIGDYLVDDLENGIYELNIEAPGYDPLSYPDAILVLSGWIESFISPVLYPSYSVEEQTQDHMNRISLNVYPSPFRHKTDIRWQVPDNSSNVNLKIYDATGRLMKQWDYATMRLSDHITWDGTDDNGSTVARGVYFYKLETDEANITVKTVFLK